MALVSGRGSTLNPNAPPFIPAVYRQVEDYSSEWWNLVQNSSGFRDHWLSEHQEGCFEGLSDSKKDDDITNLLPDTFDVGYDAEEFPNVEAEFEEMVNSFETYENRRWRTDFKAQHHHHHQLGPGLDAGAFMRSLNMYSPSSNRRGMTSLVEAAKYNERPVHQINLNHGPRRIHQPR